MDGSLQQLIDQQVTPQVQHYFTRFLEAGNGLVIEGVHVFSGNDVMVAGTILEAGVHLALTAPDDETRSHFLNRIGNAADFLVHTETQTWGILFAVRALCRLQEKGLLERAISADTLEGFRSKLDWRTFVRQDDLTLMGLPTNYYGVALGIAGYREQLGWDQSGTAAQFYDRLMALIDAHSGRCGYMDDTPGDGRFDLYSVSVPAEMYGRFRAAGLPVPERLRVLFRRSVDLFLHLANTRGHGFSYGRSIGAYGDFLGALAVAAADGMLSSDEMELAYAFQVMSARKMMSFWWDGEMRSFNLWEKGRRTDGYRHKGRILEVNLGLFQKLIEANQNWNRAGFRDRLPARDFAERLAALPPFRWFPFADGTYERGLAIIRDREHVISLPVINGGRNAYTAGPYLPIPHENQVLEATPGTSGHPQLIPRLTLADGSSVMPISFMKRIQQRELDGVWELSYELDELCKAGEAEPVAFSGLRAVTLYRFSPGMIERTDTFFPHGEPVGVREIAMEFVTSAAGPRVEGNRVRFDSGPVSAFTVVGLNLVQVENVTNQEEYQTSHGPQHTRTVWSSGRVSLEAPVTVNWVLTTRSASRLDQD